MLFLPLVLIPVLAGGVTYALVRRWPRVDPASARVAHRTAQKVEHELIEQRGIGRFVQNRRNPAVATGLLLTVAAAVIVVGGLLLGALAVLVRGHSRVVSVDQDISRWVNDRSTPFAHDLINVLTHLGDGWYVIGIAVVVAIVEIVRTRSRWIVPFLAVVLIGESLVTTAVKNALERARPTLNPTAHFLGPSFPSGHTATAAAFFAAVALLMGRGRGPRAHALLAGAAVGMGVLVACTRVLLDVHWLSDVLGGLALGWAWFALCSIAFGGRLLRLGAPVEAAQRLVAAQTPGSADAPPSAETPGSVGARAAHS